MHVWSVINDVSFPHQCCPRLVSHKSGCSQFTFMLTQRQVLMTVKGLSGMTRENFIPCQLDFILFILIFFAFLLTFLCFSRFVTASHIVRKTEQSYKLWLSKALTARDNRRLTPRLCRRYKNIFARGAESGALLPVRFRERSLFICQSWQDNECCFVHSLVCCVMIHIMFDNGLRKVDRNRKIAIFHTKLLKLSITGCVQPRDAFSVGVCVLLNMLGFV